MGSIDIALNVTAPEWVFYTLGALFAVLAVNEAVKIYSHWRDIRKL